MDAKESIAKDCAVRILNTIKHETRMTYGIAKKSLECAATLLEDEPIPNEKDSRST